jgi:two-component system sensor histidine kinase KdpD
MARFSYLNQNLRRQFLISISATIVVLMGCYLVSDFIGYRVVALLLLVMVSIYAIFLDIRPVLVAATLSALSWNFFFIPPRFTLAINSAEDLLVFLMYFLVALVNAVLTSKIRAAEKEANRRREREHTIRLYNTLLNSLSHELRTPISTIIGASDNLISLADKLSEFNKYELINEISKAALQLNRQVGNLLNMSRLESGHLKPKADWVDVRELVHDVVKQFKTILGNKPVHMHFPENLPLVKLDYGLLFHILHNLLHNAITYIPKYAVISIKAIAGHGKLTLIVEDTGNGFPPHEIARVFDKFYRLRNSGTGGTGLGLSIVKGFVEAMNGSVRLENRGDGGAKFTIEIPSELSYVNVNARG